ncbi:MAG: hypothetical protein EBY76_07390 [Betaproteobacteria bacterium]|nr:hypothetical protein [Betaproteobacteria bacterium]
MAPEYFFYSARQAYQTDDVQRTIARLQALAADGDWVDWIFSFGTIVGTSAPMLNGGPRAYYNFALIQEGDRVRFERIDLEAFEKLWSQR